MWEIFVIQIKRPDHKPFLLSLFIILAVLLAGFSGCAPPSSSPGDGNQNPPASAPNDLPEFTEEIIPERINGAGGREVPEEYGKAEPISWNFDDNEPKEITVVEKQIDGEGSAIVLDIKTGSAPNMRNQLYPAGQIRPMWELKSGWALRKWEIVGTENISIKYKDLPKSPAENSNR